MAKFGFLSRLKNAVMAFGTTEAMDPYRYARTLPMPVNVAGIHLTPQNAMQIATVWACMDAITKAIASCEWKVYAVDSKGREELPDDAVGHLLNWRPNPEMTPISFRECLYYSAVGAGNAYAEIVYNAAGKVMELWPLPAERMWVKRHYDEDGKPGGLYYEFHAWSGRINYLEPWQVFHLRGPSLDGLIGDNMLARAARAIGLAAAQERYASNYFGNNTLMGTILEYPRTLSKEAHDRLKQDWEDKHAGPDRSNKPMILEGGMKMTEVGHKPAEAQVVDARVFSVEEICRFFGVPPHKVQHLLRATFNNIEHLGIEFTRDAITPWAKRGEQEANYKLFPQKAPWRETKLDTAWLQFGDAKTRSEYYGNMKRYGIYSVNTILRKEGENTIGPEGDVRTVEKTMTTVKGMVQEVELAKKKVDIAEKTANKPPPSPPGGGETPPDNGGKKPDEDGTPPDNGGKKPENDGAKKPDPARKSLTDAVRAMVGGALDRYQRRMQNREADLRRNGKHSEASIAGKLVDARAEQRPKLIAEFEEAVSIVAQAGSVDRLSAVTKAVNCADLVDNGADPEEVALRYVLDLLKEW